MADWNDMQYTSKKNPACPRCHRHDNIENADERLDLLDHEAALAHHSGADHAALYFRRDHQAIDHHLLAGAHHGHLGRNTRFCFFKVPGYHTVYVCNYQH
ncbi:unnamed protein product [Didymodactylos carnosus]|uniref:Uncharacterized protein n=1 Tax=Didymodactylos carnosus TaxID=1234261 RepID=A0A815PD71_9BILA|nr:unnamed protein product [Didymodactylos carnosus]CAF4321831.1 unnamed protein product [Didymodactylos carnosus]